MTAPKVTPVKKDNTVTLDDGVVVTFHDNITRKMEKAYMGAMNKGIKYGLEDGEVTAQDIDPSAVDEATEAILPLLIVTIKKGDTLIEYSMEWLEGLLETEYMKLAQYVLDLRAELDKLKQKGKKNSAEV